MIRLLFLAAGALAAGMAAAHAEPLTVVTRSGSAHTVLHDVFVQPFADSSGLPVTQETWTGGLDVLRSHAGGWDVVQVSADELAAGCKENVFEKPDWNAIGGKDHYLPQAVSDCGVGAIMRGLVLSWDRNKFSGTPTWSDFWDIAKVPGKRGLRRTARGTLEAALLADGVAPADIYTTLGTKDGVERAFRKLDQLRPYIVWWQEGAKDAPELLGSGEVLMTSAPAEAVAAAAHGSHNFGVQWAGALLSMDSWVIPKGSPNVAAALKFLAFAGDPKRGAALAPLGFGGLAKGANDGLPPDQLAFSPTAPANLSAALIVDEAFWRQNGDKLNQRFETWAAH
jgi:putative spermidine/putrescine transport system substrate-binding protein